jgi:hypothetical protein
MCKERTRPDDEEFGRLFALCKNYQECLLRELKFDPDPDAQTARNVFAAFSGTVVVVEKAYFDMDFRSEFSATHETSFTAKSLNVVRIHFFSGKRPPKRIYMRDYVEQSQSSYLGYVIRRPQSSASIGRSLIPPRRRVGYLRCGMQERVRTAVSEEVSLFGVPLRAVGVPFMEQDGHLLRCSHVTTWTAHYTAVLRGLVSRRSSASFAVTEHAVQAYGRSYPSVGVSDLQHSQMLRRADLPPDFADGGFLKGAVSADSIENDLRWYRRPTLLAGLTGNPETDAPAYLAESLTTYVCRYLNSGMPSILNTDQHSVMIVGYLRRRDVDLAKFEELHGPINNADVVGFVVQNDQVGPFEVVPVAALVDAIIKRLPFCILVPLPIGLWLDGSVAEDSGARVLNSVILERRKKLTSGRHRYVTARGAKALEKIASQLDGSRKSDLTLRSYADSGADFKREFGERVRDPVASRIMGHAALPKYVWVVELIDRQRRTEDRPPVLATVVLDGSAVSAPGWSPPTPLVAHIPGETTLIGPDVFDDRRWFASASWAPYRSGRWNPESVGESASEATKTRATARRAKTAT